jgi:hypothetical protein
MKGRKEEEEETWHKLILRCRKFIGCAAECIRNLKDLKTS